MHRIDASQQRRLTWFFEQASFINGTRRTYLPKRQYIAFVATAGLLALGQLVLLPRYLNPSDFALAVLAISLTQGIQQFADLGFNNASMRRDINRELRQRMRDIALCLSTVISAIACLVLIVMSFWNTRISVILLMSVLTAWVLATSRLRASTAMQYGDEVKTTRENMTWQNSSKIGMILAAPITASALGVGAGGLIAALVLGRPRLPRWKPVAKSLRVYKRYWIPGAGIVVAGFLMNWTESYLLTFYGDLTETGEYQAIQRPMMGVTYVYLPLLSLLQVSLNAGHRRRTLLLTSAILLGTALMLVLLGTIITQFGSVAWNMYEFPPKIVGTVGLALGMSCASATVGIMLVVRGYHTQAALATGVGVVVLVVLSARLIPHGGAFGAAVASATSWAAVAGLQSATLIVLARRDRNRRIIKENAKCDG